MGSVYGNGKSGFPDSVVEDYHATQYDRCGMGEVVGYVVIDVVPRPYLLFWQSSTEFDRIPRALTLLKQSRSAHYAICSQIFEQNEKQRPQHSQSLTVSQISNRRSKAQ